MQSTSMLSKITQLIFQKSSDLQQTSIIKAIRLFFEKFFNITLPTSEIINHVKSPMQQCKVHINLLTLSTDVVEISKKARQIISQTNLSHLKIIAEQFYNQHQRQILISCAIFTFGVVTYYTFYKDKIKQQKQPLVLQINQMNEQLLEKIKQEDQQIRIQKQQINEKKKSNHQPYSQISERQSSKIRTNYISTISEKQNRRIGENQSRKRSENQSIKTHHILPPDFDIERSSTLSTTSINRRLTKYCCPISRNLMEDPVSLKCSHEFQRKNIIQYIQKYGTCQVCNEEAQISDIRSLQSTKKEIMYLNKKHEEKDRLRRQMETEFESTIIKPQS